MVYIAGGILMFVVVWHKFSSCGAAFE